MPDGVVCDEAEVKYPLSVVATAHQKWKYDVVDADHTVVCHVEDIARAYEFADFIASKANSWRRFRRWFRPCSREDWLWEQTPR